MTKSIAYLNVELETATGETETFKFNRMPCPGIFKGSDKQQVSFYQGRHTSYVRVHVPQGIFRGSDTLFSSGVQPGSRAHHSTHNLRPEHVEALYALGKITKEMCELNLQQITTRANLARLEEQRSDFDKQLCLTGLVLNKTQQKQLDAFFERQSLVTTLESSK